MNDFTLSATVTSSYDATVARVRELLVDAGFGVLTEIDLASTLREKIGADIEPRVVLGVCRPVLAHRALLADPRIATMLPCNVVVAALGEGETIVEVFDPALMAEISPALADVASEARERLSEMMGVLTGDVEDSDATRA